MADLRTPGNDLSFVPGRDLTIPLRKGIPEEFQEEREEWEAGILAFHAFHSSAFQRSPAALVWRETSVVLVKFRKIGMGKQPF
ncbi:MAG TPA: hypothetical protein VGD64_08465 [Acidisarcina sp.]